MNYEPISILAESSALNMVGSVIIWLFIGIAAVIFFLVAKSKDPNESKKYNIESSSSLLTSEEIANNQFEPTKYREGYDSDEVDQFIDQVTQEMTRMEKENESLELKVSNPDSPSPSLSNPIVTPEGVVNQRFKPTKFRTGYDQDDVDDYLDRIVVALRSLTEENKRLRAQIEV